MSEEIKQTFHELEHEMESLDEPMEISVTTLNAGEKNDNTRILYELIELSIDDPDQDKKYRSISTNKSISIKSSKLENELMKFEASFRKPAVGRKLSEMLNKKSPSGGTEISQIESARLHKLLDRVIDFFIIVLSTILISSLYCETFEKTYISSGFAFWSWTDPEILLYLSVLVPTFMFIGFSYLFFFLVIFGKTIADYIFGYELKSNRGTPLDIMQILARIITMPLFFFTVSNKNIPDFVSGTEIKRT